MKKCQQYLKSEGCSRELTIKFQLHDDDDEKNNIILENLHGTFFALCRSVDTHKSSPNAKLNFQIRNNKNATVSDTECEKGQLQQNSVVYSLSCRRSKVHSTMVAALEWYKNKWIRTPVENLL